MKRAIRWGFPALVILLALAGCSSDTKKEEPKPFATPTPAPIAWLRPQQAITQELFPQVRATGLMSLHQQTVNGVAFSASGTRFASVGADNTTVVWNLANGEPLYVRTDTDGRTVFFGPQDETLITVSSDGYTRVWSMDPSPPRTLEEIIGFAGEEALSGMVVQSPDQSLLAFGSDRGTVRVWLVPQADIVAEFQAHSATVQTLAFSPDSTKLVTTSTDQGVRVWSLPDGDLVYDLTNPELSPLRATFSPDGQWLAVAHQSGIEVWHMDSGESAYFVEAPDYAASNALVFSPNGELLAGCGPNPVINIWAAATGELLGGLPLPGQVCANILFSPDSELLLTLPSPGRDVFLWDIVHIPDDVPPEEKQLRRRNRDNMGLYGGAQFYNIAWSPDGRFIMLIDELGPMYVLSAAE